MFSAKVISASALAIAATCGVASAQESLPEGRIYVFHSSAPQAGCHALDWHLVVGADNTLVGYDLMGQYEVGSPRIWDR
jgi:hypothetical protein